MYAIRYGGDLTANAGRSGQADQPTWNVGYMDNECNLFRLICLCQELDRHSFI